MMSYNFYVHFIKSVWLENNW